MTEPLRFPAVLVLLAAILAGCGGGAPATTPDPGRAEPTSGGPGPAADPVPPADGPTGETQIVLEIGGRSILLPNIAICSVSGEGVEISASDAARTAGLTVSWRADREPAETSIIWIDPAARGALVAGPDVSAESSPEVGVSGHTVEIVTELHDQIAGRPSLPVRILASCPDSPAEPDSPTQPPVGSSGRASFTADGREHSFDFSELCQIGSDSATAYLTDAEGSSFDLIVMGQTGFFTVTMAGGEQWSAGLSGEPVQPSITGSSASWSGTAFETYSQLEAPASFGVECAQ
jgi:hypothetical protein